MIKLKKDFLRNKDLGLLVLRVGLGGMMLFHGIHKLMHGVGAIAGMLANLGLPTFLAYGTYLGEVVAPIMIVAGYRTRIGSFVFAVNMIVAILMAHMTMLFSVDAATGGWLIELPMLYLIGATALCFSGGGKYAMTRGTVFD
jgi:putative oxidoreductase